MTVQVSHFSDVTISAVSGLLNHRGHQNQRSDGGWPDDITAFIFSSKSSLRRPVFGKCRNAGARRAGTKGQRPHQTFNRYHTGSNVHADWPSSVVYHCNGDAVAIGANAVKTSAT